MKKITKILLILIPVVYFSSCTTSGNMGITDNVLPYLGFEVSIKKKGKKYTLNMGVSMEMKEVGSGSSSSSSGSSSSGHHKKK